LLDGTAVVLFGRVLGGGIEKPLPRGTQGYTGERLGYFHAPVFVIVIVIVIDVVI
jgi:hypothetical protein